MENHYRLLSTITDEDTIQINVLHNEVLLLNKFLVLDLNGDNTPTFANSRLPYNEINMENFIDGMTKNVDYMFAFDYDDDPDSDQVFDGMLYHGGSKDIGETLIIKISNGKLNMAIHMSLEHCKNTIISDLQLLKDNIHDLYEKKMKYISKVYDEDESDSSDEDEK